MPEWIAQLGLGALLSVIGYMVVRIDRKLDRLDERMSKTERDCVTWPELEKVSLRVGEHERRISIIETVCKSERTRTKHGQGEES